MVIIINYAGTWLTLKILVFKFLTTFEHNHVKLILFLIVGSVQKSKTKKRHAAVVDGELAISGMTHESKKSKKKESVSDDEDDLFVHSGDKSGSSNHGNYYYLR